MVDKYELKNSINLTSDDNQKDYKLVQFRFFKKQHLDNNTEGKISNRTTKKNVQQKLILKKVVKDNSGSLYSNINKSNKINFTELKNDGSFFSRERKNNFSYKFQRVTELLNHTKKINDEYNKEKMDILESQNRYKVSGHFVKDINYFDIKLLKEKVNLRKFRTPNRLVLKSEKLHSKEDTCEEINNEYQDLCNMEEQSSSKKETFRGMETKTSLNKESMKDLSSSSMKKESNNNFSYYLPLTTDNSIKQSGEIEYYQKNNYKKQNLRNFPKEESIKKIYFKKKSRNDPFIDGFDIEKSRNNYNKSKINQIQDRDLLDTPSNEYIEKAQKNVKEEFFNKYLNLIKSLNLHRATLTKLNSYRKNEIEDILETKKNLELGQLRKSYIEFISANKPLKVSRNKWEKGTYLINVENKLKEMFD